MYYDLLLKGTPLLKNFLLDFAESRFTLQEPETCNNIASVNLADFIRPWPTPFLPFQPFWPACYLSRGNI